MTPPEREEAREYGRRCSAAVLAVFVLIACGSARSTAGTAIVTVTGRIGPLLLDRSDRAAVIGFAGRPDAERHGQTPGYAPYDALGYGCGKRHATDTAPLVEGRPPYCRTVFFINHRTGRLETFFSSSTDYVEGHGVRIGMATSTAERRLHKRLFEGCETNIYLKSSTADLTIAFTGGRAKAPTLRVNGGHVYAFVLHSRRSDAGVFDCM
jgi:hypothetical protein